MKAVQDLASDEAISLDDDIDGLKTALENSKFIAEADQASHKETATAAATLVKILSKAGLDQWRKSEVKQLIRETNPAVQQAIGGFVDILDVDLRQSLVNEKTAIHTLMCNNRPVVHSTYLNSGLSGHQECLKWGIERSSLTF
jgi:hypothetical protein